MPSLRICREGSILRPLVQRGLSCPSVAIMTGELYFTIISDTHHIDNIYKQTLRYNRYAWVCHLPMGRVVDSHIGGLQRIYSARIYEFLRFPLHIPQKYAILY